MTEEKSQRFIEGDCIYYSGPLGKSDPIIGVIVKGGWKRECRVRWYSRKDGGWIFERFLPSAPVTFVGPMPFWAEWDIPDDE